MIADNHLLDHVTQQFLNALHNDTQVIQTAAQHLFYYLVVIQLAVSSLMMVLAGDGFYQSVVKLIKLSILWGILYTLIHTGDHYVPQVLNGFIQLGQQSGVSSLDPSSIVDQGVRISSAIFQGFFGWGLLGHPFVAIVGAIVCIMILVIYGFIAAELAIVLVKAYVLVALNGLFFALGATEATREMTKNYYRSIIGLGLNLMTLYFLLGVGQNMGVQWASMTAAAAQQHQLMPMLVILATVIVYYLILKNVPAFIAGLAGVGGFQHHGAAAVGMAMNVGTSSVNALMQGRRMTGYGIRGAAQMMKTGIHSVKSFQDGYQQGGGGFEGIKTGFCNIASNMGSAAANTLKNTITKPQHSAGLGQQFTDHLANTARRNHSRSKKQ